MDNEIKEDYILPFTKYLNKPKKSVSFEKKVKYEYTYGKDIYDRKPIENVEQITIRELYELTLSRIEARKSNVYYSNQKPKSKELMDSDDISEYINDDSISEEKKVKIVGKAEQEKLNNMEVDELEVKSKNLKKIKITNILNNENDKTSKGIMNNGENLIQQGVTNSLERNSKISCKNQIKGDIITSKENKTEDNSAKTEIITEKEMNKIEKQVPKLNISVLKQLEAPFDPRLISPRTTSNEISTFKNKREREYMKKEEILKNEEFMKKEEILKKQEQIQMQMQMQNQKINPELISPRSTSFDDKNSPKDNASPTGGNNVFLPNGKINYKNLPEKFVSPRRRDSKNRIIINSQLDLAHYKPPIKSLAEINDPNYEEKVGSEPVPYGSCVYYEEPEITSPNLENAIPNYHRPMIDYRNNLMNITKNNDEMGQSSPKSSVKSSDSVEKSPTKEREKKSKEKKSNRKSLSIFNILKKSKSAENIKAKSRKSFFKPVHKNHSTPPNKNSSPENKNNQHHHHSSSPLSKAQNITNDNKSSKNSLSRVTMFNKYQEPTIDDLIAEGPGFANNDNKPMSKYALKTLKLRQSDSSLHVNTANLHLTVPTSPNHLRSLSPISVRSIHSAHSAHSTHSTHSAHSSHSSHSAQSNYSSPTNEFENYHNSPKGSITSNKYDSNISPHKPIISPLSKPTNT